MEKATLLLIFRYLFPLFQAEGFTTLADGEEVQYDVEDNAESTWLNRLDE